MPDLYSLGDSFDQSIATYGTQVNVQLLTELDTNTNAIKRSPRSFNSTLPLTTLGATTITLPSMPVGLTVLPVGSSIVFTISSVEYVVKVKEAATTGNLTIDVSRVPVAIPANTACKLFPMYRILGGNSIGLKFNDKEVETRAFESGIWSDAKKVMAGAVGSWAGFYPQDDDAYQLIILPAVKSSQEVFAELVYPNGMMRYASAYIQNYNENSKNDDVVQSSFDFRFVTEIFFRTVDNQII